MPPQYNICWCDEFFLTDAVISLNHIIKSSKFISASLNKGTTPFKIFVGVVFYNRIKNDFVSAVSFQTYH